MKILSIIIIALSLCISTSFADDQSSGVCVSGYKVYYLNGIFSDPIDRTISAHVVKQMIGNSYNGETLTVYVSNNPSSWNEDLLEVFAQKLEEDPTLSWQLFFKWVSGSFISSALTQALLDYFDINYAQEARELIERLASTSSYSDSTVVDLASTYYSSLLNGYRVMVVPHSQGNLYANAIYNKLNKINDSNNQKIDTDAFGTAGAASPANYVATGDGYVTSDTDHVIDLLRAVVPTTLPSNDDSVPFTTNADRLGHGFLGIYTNSSFEIREHLYNVMQSTLNRISTVVQQFAGGPITATLTWSSNADIDLHIYDPSTHVYYANMQSDIGYLDYDDTVYTGPEHYYSSCENFKEGIYKFGVNYFSGSGSITAYFKLSVLGVDYPTRSITVTTPEGSSGNNSPTILWNVNIEKNGDGSYSADVN